MNPVIMFHIAVACVALLAGTTAMTARKGGRLHAGAGKLFVVAMLAMFTAGILFSFFKDNPGRLLVTSSVVGGYLVATAYQSARRKDGVAGLFEKIGLAVAIACGGVYVWLSYMAASAPTGRIDGVGHEVILPNLFVALIAAALDINFIVRSRIGGKQRIARHTWRISMGMFVVTSAFFLGGFGQKFFIPKALHGSMLLAIPPLAVLLFMAFWLVRLRFANPVGKHKRAFLAGFKRIANLAGAGLRLSNPSQGVQTYER